MPATAHRVSAVLRPPKELLARLRWCFLAFVLFFVVTYLPQLLIQSVRPWPVRIAAGALLVGLGLWWLRCYRRGRFPAAGLILECAAFGACILVPTDPFKGLGLLYIAVNFRSLYGTLRQVVGFTVVATTCFVAATVAAPHLGSVDRLAMLGYVLPGVLPLAVIAHLVSVASSRAMRSTAREQLLSRAGLTIAEAGTAEATRAAALTAVAELLGDVPTATAGFIDGDTTPAPDTTGGHVVDLPVRVNGEVRSYLRIRSTGPLPDEVGDALSVLAAQVSLGLSNVSLTEDLRRRADHDPLTGLANRRTVEDRLAAALRTASDDRPVATLMIDLDGFKQVNDTLGHAAGDALLIDVAERLRGHVRAGDMVARLGGDEFVVVLAGRHDVGDLYATAVRLLEEIRRPVALDLGTTAVGASIGIALGRPGLSPTDLLRDADAAMYEAKRSGKNGIRVARAADQRTPV